MPYKPVSRNEAKQIIDDAEFGYLIVGESEHIPIIGSVDPKELRMKVETRTYKFDECTSQRA